MPVIDIYTPSVICTNVKINLASKELKKKQKNMAIKIFLYEKTCMTSRWFNLVFTHSRFWKNINIMKKTRNHESHGYKPTWTKSLWTSILYCRWWSSNWMILLSQWADNKRSSSCQVGMFYKDDQNLHPLRLQNQCYVCKIKYSIKE